MMFFKKKKRKDEVFAKYPCSVFLHNSLRLLTENKPEAAYEEICYAIIRSGGVLTAMEKMTLMHLCEKKGGSE